MTVAMLPTPRALAAAATCVLALVAGPAPSAPGPQRPPLAPVMSVATATAPPATPGLCTARVRLDAPAGAWIDVVLPPGWVVEADLPDEAWRRAFGVRLPASSGAVDLTLRRLTAEAAPIHAEVHHDGPDGAITEPWSITGCGS